MQFDQGCLNICMQLHQHVFYILQSGSASYNFPRSLLMKKRPTFDIVMDIFCHNLLSVNTFSPVFSTEEQKKRNKGLQMICDPHFFIFRLTGHSSMS